MFTAIAQFFSAICVLFSAAERGAKSLDNLAAYGELQSEVFLKKSQLESASDIRRLTMALDAIEKAEANTVPQLTAQA